MDAFWELYLPSGVPSGLVHHQKDVLVLSSAHLLGELSEGQGEQLGVNRGQDQPVHLSGCGPYKAIEVAPYHFVCRSGTLTG